ncbi:hypothetical protein [Bacteroides eggerthii]|uniref:hypothetical protein n=1 Tax=Bacteroides eggerthii TaxID=28111 RepID=UPI001898473C|nr:hypothetical protein [Bacteroides eggerthii]
MNLRWRDPAAVMHRDFVIFNSNSTITARFSIRKPFIHITLVDEQLEPRDSYDLGFITTPGEYDDELLDYTIDEKFGIKTYAVYGNPYPPIAIEANPKGDNQFLGWYYESGELFTSLSTLDDQDIEYLQGSEIYASFSRRAVDRSATVTIRLIEADVRLEGGSLPLDWPADFAEAHVYKLSSTNGITGTLKLKQSEFATHTYNLTHQKSYYPLTFYRDQQPTIVRFTNWEWAIGDEFTSGSFTSLNDINATLKYNNVTYTLKGRN